MRMIYYKALSKEYDFSLDTPWNELSPAVRDVLLYGSKGKKLRFEYDRDFGSGSFLAAFEGIIPSIERRYNETQSDIMKEAYRDYIRQIPCPDCGGKRLN